MKNLCCISVFPAILYTCLCIAPLKSLHAQVPAITGISPVAAAAGSSVTINGSNFSSTISSNVVWFGGVKGTVTAASTTALTVTVPAGAGNPVSVYTSNLVAQSPVQFIYTFPGLAPLSASSFTAFTPSQAFVVQNGSYNGLSLHSTGNLKYADLDGDKKPDMIEGRTGLYVQFNTSAPGLISAGTIDNGTVTGASFEARYGGGGVQGLLSELTSYGTNAAQEGDIDFGDIDGDGKLDIISCVYRPGNGDRISIFRNITSASGSLSNSNFDNPVIYSTGGRWARRIRLADFDNDGKLDVLVSTSNGGAMFRNTSAPGSISFAPIANLSAGIVEDFIEVADIDGDGKTDIVARPYGNGQVKVLRNTSSGIGTISFAAAQSFTIEAGGTGIELGDLDGDGKTDILASGNSGKLYVLRNTSSGGSVNFALYHTIITSISANIADATLGDLDGDGKSDIAFNDGNYTIYVVKNNSTSGSLSFGADAALNPSGGLSQYSSEVVIQDIDGDGRNDIISASTYSNGIHYFTNNTASIILPVSWLGFTARSKPGGVQLQWSTASEKDNSYFDIERSIDEGKSFHAIGRVPGSMNSSVAHTYQWLDADALPKAWYRIKQVDIDQKASYSMIAQVNHDGNITIQLSPNPVKDRLEVRLPASLRGTYELRILDQQGKQVLHRQANAGTIVIDGSAWGSGLYRVFVYKGKELLVSKAFVKQ